LRYSPIMPRTLACAALALSALATTAAAQSAGGPPPPPARVGWELGFGIYGGEINCENENGDFCDGVTEAGGIDLHANYFFTPTWGAYVDVFPMFHSEDNWTFTHNIVTAGVKWRPAPIFTFTAGVGSAQARLRYEVAGLQGEAETEVVGAILIGARSRSCAAAASPSTFRVGSASASTGTTTTATARPTWPAATSAWAPRSPGSDRRATAPRARRSRRG
jgi:opacity protein-like surface antigen